MAWFVEFMDEKVSEAFEEFPLDIRATFQRIAELIQSHGLERVRDLCEPSGGSTLGNAHEGQKRNRTRRLRDSSLQKKIVIVHVFVKKTHPGRPVAKS